jgi:hypothetical protein
MNIKATLVLLAVAAVVGLVILLDSGRPGQEDRPVTTVLRDVKDDEVRAIEIVVGDRTVRIEKRTEAAEPWWEIVKPFKAPADKQAVTSLLSDVRYLSFKGRVKEEEAKAKGDAAFGLDTPRAVLRLEAPQRSWRLSFGKASPIKDEELYARADGQPGVFVIDKRLLESLQKPAEDLQDRTLVAVESWKADRIALTIGGEEAEVVKKDADWNIEKPEEIREKAEYTPVSTFLNNLRDLRWKEWVAEKPSDDDLAQKYGLKPPVSRFAVSSTEAKKTDVLLVGKPVPRDPEKDKEKPVLVYARKGEAGPVVAVEASALEKLPRRVDLLRTKKIWTVSVDALAKIEVKVGDAVALLERPKGGGDWAFAKPEGVKSDGGLVGEFVTALTGAEIEEFYERKMADPKTYGFDQPAAWLGLTTRTSTSVTTGEGDKKETKTEEKLEAQVWLFGTVKGGKVFVKREDRGQVVEIKPDLLEKVRLGALLFRSKALVETRPEDIQTLAVERMERGRADYAKYACVRENGQWVLKEPAGAAIDVQRVNAVVSTLYGLRALSWVSSAAAPDAYGLGKPQIKVAFSWTETKEVRKEAKPADTKPADVKPADAKPVEKKDAPPAAKGEAGTDGKAGTGGAADAKPADVKPSDAPKPEEKKDAVERVTTTHSRVLLVGDLTKAKDGHYCRFEGDPAVFTLSKSMVETLDQEMVKKAE